MKKPIVRPRRVAAHITLGRASRLYHLLRFLSESSRTRDQILTTLRIGLRTFYREIELLKRLGVRVRLSGKVYELRTTMADCEERLPFPDPLMTFAEMKELALCDAPVARRLTALYNDVVSVPESPPLGGKRRSRARRAKPSS